MDITAKITGIKYKILSPEKLKEISMMDFDVNKIPSSCLLETDNRNTFAISKWVSPKRTRSYPFERVFNTLHISKKITIIPIIKDEGLRGERDFIQWDTVSLMSLLDVFVIFAYYDSAEKKGEKITNQQFDSGYVRLKIKEIEQFHSSALHWNLNELKTNLHCILDNVKIAYANIEKLTGVKLHGVAGIENFKIRIGDDVSSFMEFSRGKAQKAQLREFVTLQPKESLSTLSKAKMTIFNYLGGAYFFTVDEVLLLKDTLFLIESKHSRKTVLPSKGDIKDGLLKMILYSNLTQVRANEKIFKSKPVLKLTSSMLNGRISSTSSFAELDLFFYGNQFTNAQKEFIGVLLEEARENHFIVQIEYSK